MSGVIKHSVTIRGHRTSFSLELPFFHCLNALAAKGGIGLAALVAEVDEQRARQSSLSSALRLFVLEAAKRGEFSPAGDAVVHERAR